MSLPIVVFWDGKIVLNICDMVLSNVGNPIRLETFITKLGLLIPIKTKSLTAFNIAGMCLINPTKDTELIPYVNKANIKEESLALLLTPSGKVLSISNIELEPFTFFINQLCISEDTRKIITYEVDTNEILHAITNQATSLNDAWIMIHNTVPISYRSHHKIFVLSELVDWIKKCVDEQKIFPFEGSMESFNMDIGIIDAFHIKNENEAYHE